MGDLARQSFQHGFFSEDTLSNFRASQARLSAAMNEAARSVRVPVSVVLFQRGAGFSSPAIIRPDIEDVINVERGMPVQNKGGCPSHDLYHEHHRPRILELRAEGKGPWTVARLIIREVRPPKGYRQVTDNPEDAMAFGLVFCRGDGATDSLYRFVKKIAP